MSAAAPWSRTIGRASASELTGASLFAACEVGRPPGAEPTPIRAHPPARRFAFVRLWVTRRATKATMKGVVKSTEVSYETYAVCLSCAQLFRSSRCWLSKFLHLRWFALLLYPYASTLLTIDAPSLAPWVCCGSRMALSSHDASPCGAHPNNSNRLLSTADSPQNCPCGFATSVVPSPDIEPAAAVGSAVANQGADAYA